MCRFLCNLVLLVAAVALAMLLALVLLTLPELQLCDGEDCQTSSSSWRNKENTLNDRPASADVFKTTGGRSAPGNGFKDENSISREKILKKVGKSSPEDHAKTSSNNGITISASKGRDEASCPTAEKATGNQPTTPPGVELQNHDEGKSCTPQQCPPQPCNGGTSMPGRDDSNGGNLHHYIRLGENITYGETRRCTRRDVMFLNVNTCEKSEISLTSIFLRYGLLRNLNVMLPKYDDTHFYNVTKTSSNPEPFHTRYVLNLPKNKEDSYNVVANKMVYASKQLRPLLPKGTSYTAIVRQPMEVLRCALRNFNLKDFAKNPKKYEKDWKRDRHLRNIMANDFGFNTKLLDGDEDDVEDFVEDIEEDFNFVMVREYLDESLVLLKRHLCWDLYDILHYKFPETSHFYLDKSGYKRIQATIKQWSTADFYLYKKFSKSFHKKLKNEKNDFWDEVKHFKTMRDKVEAFCKPPAPSKFSKIIPKKFRAEADRTIHFPASRWNPEFWVTREFCDILEMSDASITILLKSKYYQRQAQLLLDT